jgi:hypothetical protein
MSGKVPNLFDNLSLKYWYTYLLYVSGILLILTIVVGSKIDIDRVLGFSLWTMGISIFLWILDDIFDLAHEYYQKEHDVAIEWTRYIIYFVFFIIWIIIVANAFY